MAQDEFQIGLAKIRFVKGDITDMKTDGIVNAANSALMGGGGVDGAIHRKGGPKVLEECLLIRQSQYPNGLPTGQAVITSGGNLKARYVIHTVGPVWRDGTHGEPEMLGRAYLSSLVLALHKGLQTLAFPSISTGAYGFPIEQASRVALDTVVKFLEIGGLDEVVFVLFSDSDLAVYRRAASEILARRTK